MRLSKREIVLLYVLSLCLIAFLSVTFIIAPMSKSIESTTKAITAGENDLRARRHEYNLYKDVEEKIATEKVTLENNRGSIRTYMNDTKLSLFATKYFLDKSFVLKGYLSSSYQVVNKITDILVCAVNVTLKKTYASVAALEADIKSLVLDLYGYMQSAIINQVEYSYKSVQDAVESDIIVNFSIYMSKGESSI